MSCCAYFSKEHNKFLKDTRSMVLLVEILIGCFLFIGSLVPMFFLVKSQNDIWYDYKYDMDTGYLKTDKTVQLLCYNNNFWGCLLEAYFALCSVFGAFAIFTAIVLLIISLVETVIQLGKATIEAKRLYDLRNEIVIRMHDIDDQEEELDELVYEKN